MKKIIFLVIVLAMLLIAVGMVFAASEGDSVDPAFAWSRLIDYGAIGLCLLYFIYRDNTTMKDFRTTLQGLKDAILVLSGKVDNNNG